MQSFKIAAIQVELLRMSSNAPRRSLLHIQRVRVREALPGLRRQPALLSLRLRLAALAALHGGRLRRERTETEGRHRRKLV